jgi:ADP-ribosyl-[dinitrogen reductase] hydrolase
MLMQMRRPALTTDGRLCARLEDALVGSLLGTAVGDAIGLPYEGLSRRRAPKLLGLPDRHRLLFHRGMVSDDTEQTCLVAQSLIESADDVGAFQGRLLRRLRGWFLTLPAGVGLGTLRAMLKSLIGFPSDRCGVFSAGNGPAMRSAIIGVAIDDPRLLLELVQASCTLTHTDPKALYGAWAVALAANLARDEMPVEAAEYLASVRWLMRDKSADEFLLLLERVVHSVQQGQSTRDFAVAAGMGQKVSGYVYQTVPVAIHAWLTNQEDFREAITCVVQCGGDTDTTAAIVGGIVGCHVGKAGIPQEWWKHLMEWPRTVVWMERIAGQLARVVTTGKAETAASLPLAGLLARNLAFLLIVLAHGFRRLLPPY